MRKIFALLLLLWTAGAALASDYEFRDGYYWLNGRKYSRTYRAYWNPYYCRWDHAYAYHQIADPAPAKLSLSYLDPQWRVKMLELAAQRIEQKAFMDSAAALGLYMPPMYSDAQSLYSGYSPPGTTVYGSAYQALGQGWGSKNAI